MPVRERVENRTILGSSRHGFTFLRFTFSTLLSGVGSTGAICLTDTDNEERLLYQVSSGASLRVGNWTQFLSNDPSQPIPTQTGGGGGAVAGSVMEDRAGYPVTYFGSTNAPFCSLAINARTCSAFIMYRFATQVSYHYWVDSSGVLMVGNRADFLVDAGEAVGATTTPAGFDATTPSGNLDFEEEGYINIGSPRVTRPVLSIRSKSGTASGLVLAGSGGVERVLWFKNNGILMIGTHEEFLTPNSAGTAVGDQT